MNTRSATHRCRHDARAVPTQRLTPLEISILVLLALALIYAALSGEGPGPIAHDLTTTTVRVRPADTLWGVAARHRVSGLDTAQTVYVIQELNDMSGSFLATGQLLLVPAAGESATALAALD